MPAQNPAGIRNQTPTDENLLAIRDAVHSLAVATATATPLNIYLNTVFYIGDHARFTALSNGVKLEILNSGGTWVEANRWTQP